MDQAIARKFQQSEVTDHIVYHKLAQKADDPHNQNVLQKISNEEKKHYEFWRKITGEDVKPHAIKVLRYGFLARVLGLTFVVKLMEKGEGQAQYSYEQFVDQVVGLEKIIEDEGKHEAKLVALLKEKRLEYVGSIVLGLNDALVELTGVLAGLTLALQNMELIALSGLVTGIAASFSMGASEYLSKRADGENNPMTASLYTWLAYIGTVILLILPYLFLTNPFVSLAVTLVIAVLIIAGFNFYLSVAKDFSFKKRFLEMVLISLGIAGFSFVLGWLLKMLFGVEV